MSLRVEGQGNVFPNDDNSGKKNIPLNGEVKIEFPQTEEKTDTPYPGTELEMKSRIGKNINSLAKKLESNKDLPIIQTQIAEDGGYVYTYADASGKIVGYIYKEHDGKVRSVSFENNEDFAVYSDIDQNNKIDSETIQMEDAGKNGQNITLLAKSLEENKKLQVIKTLTAQDGGHINLYGDLKGTLVGSVNKDSDGKVRNVAFVDGSNLSSYTDLTKDEIIDTGTFSRRKMD